MATRSSEWPRQVRAILVCWVPPERVSLGIVPLVIGEYELFFSLSYSRVSLSFLDQVLPGILHQSEASEDTKVFSSWPGTDDPIFMHKVLFIYLFVCFAQSLLQRKS